jgi:hypothetical protein
LQAREGGHGRLAYWIAVEIVDAPEKEEDEEGGGGNPLE